MTSLFTKINYELLVDYKAAKGADGSQQTLLLSKHFALFNVVDDLTHKAYIKQIAVTAVATNLDLTALTDVYGNDLFDNGVKFICVSKPAPADGETITFSYNGSVITLGDGEIFVASGESILKQLLTTPEIAFTGSGSTIVDLILIGS